MRDTADEVVRRRYVKRNGRVPHPSIHNRRKQQEQQSGHSSTRWGLLGGIIVFLLAAAGFSLMSLHRKKPTLVFLTPSKLPRVLDIVREWNDEKTDDLFWGTYRSDLFFGIRHRSPDSLQGGLIWFDQQAVKQHGSSRIRHYCKNRDAIKSFGWKQNDGRTFGIQEIQDENFLVTTSWLKQAGQRHDGSHSWHAQFTIDSEGYRQEPISMLFYMEYDNPWTMSTRLRDNSGGLDLTGSTKELGEFKMSWGIEDSPSETSSSYVMTHKTAGRFGLPIFEHMRYDGNTVALSRQNDSNAKTVAFMITCERFPCSLHVDFGDEISPMQFSKLLAQRTKAFDDKFASTFPIVIGNEPQERIQMHKEVLSNLLGGLYYSFGKAKVQRENESKVYEYWPAPIFTCVPSRIVFPRGFIWDEAFHNLIVARWDRVISLEILAHYLDLMNVDGWIPREIILGDEAESHVPVEYIVQKTNHANPPAWFLTIDRVLKPSSKHPDHQREDVYWQRVSDRLKYWLEWFQRSQAGKVPGTFRWRGRNASTVNELNPKTLTSGLDDYPRASHPTEQERHIDLFSWVFFGQRVLSEHFNLKTDSELNFQSLSDYHWSGDMYSDYGLHTESVRLKRYQIKSGTNGATGQPILKTVAKRTAGAQPELMYVPHRGYASLYPFLLRLIPTAFTVDNGTEKLVAALDLISDPEQLWSPFGVRSLSKNSSLYGKRNTVEDPPYWRGAIWVHFNYMIISSLDFYAKNSNVDETVRVRAETMGTDLRSNLLRNMGSCFAETSTVWEQYNDQDGHGQFSPAFTGWSSLILLIADR